MKRVIMISAAIAAAVAFSGCRKDNGTDGPQKMTDADVITVFEADMETHLRNPYMGWTLYCPFNDIPSAYWRRMDEAAREYASILYIRWTWADMEPSEGQYAWDNNDRFKQFIEGARERGIRLCFRVYVDSYAQGKNATPQWVLDHAESYEPNGNNGGYLTPYGDDPYFLEKYTNFIRAFGEEFNDPTIVDYVDSYGLGFSGEENNIRWLDEENSIEAFSTIVRAYEEAFDKVVNVVNYGKSDEEAAIIYDELGFCTRRDGYGMEQWFPAAERMKFASLFPEQMLVAEAGYSYDYDWSVAEGGKYGQWVNYSKDIVKLALETNVNYLDLRDATTTDHWLEENPDGVKEFLSKGGYRICPVEVRYKTENGRLTVQHSWVNYGVGILPNHNPHLGYKYRIALGLFDSEGREVTQLLSDQIEISRLVGGNELMATDEMDLTGIGPGRYRLGIAIINTRENDSKDITLAVKDPEKITGEWVYAGDVSI